jgi:hypothetical protein
MNSFLLLFFHLYYRILYLLDSFLLVSSVHLFPSYFLCILFSIFYNLCITFSFSYPEYFFLLLQSFVIFASFPVLCTPFSLFILYIPFLLLSSVFLFSFPCSLFPALCAPFYFISNLFLSPSSIHCTPFSFISHLFLSPSSLICFFLLLKSSVYLSPSPILCIPFSFLHPLYDFFLHISSVFFLLLHCPVFLLNLISYGFLSSFCNSFLLLLPLYFFLLLVSSVFLSPSSVLCIPFRNLTLQSSRPQLFPNCSAVYFFLSSLPL